MHQNAQSKDKIRRQEEHIKNINLYQKQYAVMAIQDVVKFYVQTINYNGISEAANSHSSHLVLFRSLEEQGEGRNNAICLDKLLMLSSVMLIVPDTCRSQLEATDNPVCFSLMTQSGE